MRFRRYFAAGAMLALVSLASAQSNSKTLATVNGQAIPENQVTQAAASDLKPLDARKSSLSPEDYERQKLIILHKALDTIIEDKLVEAEAARDQTSKQQILEAEIESNIAIPTPEEVEEFYQQNKAQISIPHDQAIPQVKQYMIDQQRKHYRESMVYGLKKQFPVKVFLDPVRTPIATAGYPTRGSASAPVTIVEFADFQCPFCGGLFPTLQAVEKNYADKVRMVYRQFPLTSLHPYAQKAAEASLCANDQKRFWEFHDSMFGNQEKLTVDDLRKRADEFRMDTAAFNQCLDSGAKQDAVKKDSEEGRAAGVTSTPTMFINGRQLSGNQPYSDIRAVIEDELQRIAGNPQ